MVHDLALRELIETAPDAMLVVDGAGAIRFANSVAAELFGYSVAELEGPGSRC